jgi:hypothetical protein
MIRATCNRLKRLEFLFRGAAFSAEALMGMGKACRPECGRARHSLR